MPLPILATAALAGQGLLSAWQLMSGLTANAKRPKFNIPEEYYDMGKMLSPYKNMPGYQNAINALLGNQATSITAIKEAANPSSIAGNIGKVTHNTDNSMTLLAEKNAAYKDNATRIYANYKKSLGDLKLQEQQFNNNLKMQEISARNSLIGAGLTNMLGTLNSFAGMEMQNKDREMYQKYLDYLMTDREMYQKYLDYLMTGGTTPPPPPGDPRTPLSEAETDANMFNNPFLKKTTQAYGTQGSIDEQGLKDAEHNLFMSQFFGNSFYNSDQIADMNYVASEQNTNTVRFPYRPDLTSFLSEF